MKWVNEFVETNVSDFLEEWEKTSAKEFAIMQESDWDCDDEVTKKTYLVSTTTHDESGVQIDSWSGSYVDAEEKEVALVTGLVWERKMLLYDNVKWLSTDAKNKSITYEKNGEIYTVKIHADVM